MADGFSYEDATAKPQQGAFGYEDAVPPPKDIGALRSAADSALALTGGVTQGVKLLTDVAGADNRVSKALGGAVEFQQGLLSPQRRAEMQQRAQRIREAEASGSTLREIGASLGAFVEAPLDTTLQALGTTAPTLLAAGLTKRLPPTVAGAGLGAAQGVGAVKSSIYDATRQRAIESGLTPEAAEARAAEAQAYSGRNIDQIAVGGALGALAGSTGAERLVGRVVRPAAGSAPAGAFRRAATGAVTEAIPEAAQGGQERLAANLALQRQGYDDPLLRGVAGGAALEAVASAPIGGAFGLLDSGARPPAPGQDNVPRETIPQGDPLRDQKLPEIGPNTRAVNALIEAEAQAADQGLPVVAPVSGALAGLSPPQQVPQGAGGPAVASDEQIPVGEATEGPPDDEGAAVFDPATATIAPTPRATFDTEAEVGQYLSQQRRSGGSRQGKALPVQAADGRWTFARQGEPEFERAQASQQQREADARMQADRAVEAALPSMPQHLRDLKPADRKTFGLDKAVELAGKPLATNEPIGEEPGRAGVAFTPEIAVMQAHNAKQATKTQDGMLRSGNRTGATTAGLVESWVRQRQGEALIERSRKEQPDLWKAYDERQAALKDAKLGDTVLTPYPSLANPLGTPGVLRRKFGVNWRVELADGQAVMVPPAALRPVNQPAVAPPAPAERPAEATPTPQPPAEAPIAAPAPAQAAAPAVPSATEIDAAAAEAATSPTNNRPEPTDAQKGAGNYKKGHVVIDGMGVTIENPKGSIRKSKADDPNRWEVVMPAHYGYIKGTIGADTVDPRKPEQVDISIGPKGANGRYWVINQTTPDGKTFDEHKVFTGVDSADEAVALYKASFADGFGEKVYQSISAEYDADAFKALLPSLKKARAVKSAASNAVEKPEVQRNAAAPGEATPPAPPSAPTQDAAAPSARAEESPSARWTRSTTADRLGLLAAAGWSVNPPSLSTRRVSAQPWDKLTDSQRARIEAAMDTPSAPQSDAIETAFEAARARVASLNATLATDTRVGSGERFLIASIDGKDLPAVRGISYTVAGIEEAVRQIERAAAKRDRPVTPQVPSTITSPLGAKRADEIDKPADAVAATKALTDGKKIVLRRGTEFESRVWIEETSVGGRQTWVVKQKDADSQAVVTRGPAGPDRRWGWGQLDAAREAMRELGGFEQQAPIADTSPADEPATAPALDRPGQRALEGAPAAPVQDAAGSGDAGAGAARGGRSDLAGDAGAAGSGAGRADGVGDGARAAPVSARGAGREPAATGEPGVSGTPRPDARAGSGEDAGRAGLSQAPNAAPPVPPQFDPTAAGGFPSLDFTPPAPQDALAPRAPELDLPPVTDFRIEDDLALGEGGQKTKFRGNVEAIKLLREIEASGRLATPAEQRTLARYVGWGQLSQAFDESNRDWTREHAELKALLSPEEYEAAKESTQYAHYTSREIIAGIYAALQHMGFTGGRIVEPGAGVGNFIGLMPETLRTASRFTGIERELISSGIARQLYPQQNIQQADFTEFVGNDGYFDAAIGNPPFARQPLTDKSNRKHLSGLSVHNYFFAKSVDMLREGGILAQVVSNSFLDAKRDVARRYIADRVEFLGAIRLPNNAFAKNAGTQVTTDLIFLKKLPENEWASRSNKDNRDQWLDIDTVPDPNGGEAVPLNRYFVDHPEMMLGTMGRFGTMYGPGQPALVARPGQDTAALLQDAVAKLPGGVYVPRAVPATEQSTERAIVALGDSTVQEGGHYVADGRLYQRLEDVAGEQRAIEITPETQWTEKTKLGQSGFDRIKALAQMRTTLRSLLAAELANEDRAERLRATLNRQYDAYVKDHGLINDKPTARVFDDDPDFPLLASLEHGFTPGIGEAAARKLGVAPMKATAKKAPIFAGRVVSARTTPTRADSPADALNISLAERGRIDVEFIGKLLGQDGAEALEAMTTGDRPLLFLDPATREYVLRDAYLSGNVRTKLAQARAAGMLANARALEAVQPADVPAHEISVRLGSPWVPTQVYEDFAKQLFGDKTQATIYYTKANSAFTGNIRGVSEIAARNTWGTNDVSGPELLIASMNNRDIKVTYLDADKKLRTDVEKTEAANLKAGEIRQAFLDWAFKDADRSELLTKTYNETNNNYVTRAFDGGYMQFPGKVPDSAIKFRRHQRNAIARIMQDRTALLDHVVGAGKTFTIVSAAMEMKRTGLANKPLVVVPNHLVKQWAADFYRLYPGARVLTATKKDFQKVNRRRFLAKIATGDWDAVVMAHSSFGFIKPAPEFEARFNEKQVRSIMDTIKSVEEQDLDARDKKRTVKQLAALKERLENRIAALRDKPIDALLDFEQIGVDQLFVDEAHLFKNLMFTTKMQNVRGLGDSAGSQRAYDLFVKAHQLFEQNGRGQGLVFATGTPVSNSLAEMYHMMRYLMPAQMEAAGFASFDAWANTFASVEQTWMQKFSGDGFKADNRMSTFVNTPELLKMFDQVADTVTMDDIKAAFREENDGREFPLPKLKTGRRQPVSLVKSAAQNAYMADIAARAKAIEGKRTNQKGMDNALTIMGDARKAAMDIRLVDPDVVTREPNGRIDSAAKQIVERYRRYDNVKGTQLVFSDLGTPIKHAKKEMKEWEALQERIQKGADPETQVSANLGNESAMAIVDDAEAAQAELDAMGPDWLDAVKAALRGFSVYDDLKAALVEEGIPENEIAFIHDYNTDEQKASLFRKVNAGTIRVLMGSTPKLGAGTNVQERLVALHHLDVPWKPSDVEQREGRIIRQGNVLSEQLPDFEVEILGYVTQDTLDMRMWQIQETKLKMINQLRSRKIGREIDNAFEDMEMSAGEMQAAATGNIDLLKEIQLRSDVRKLEQQQRSFDAQRNDLETRRKRAAEALRTLPPKIEQAAKLAEASNAYAALQDKRRATFRATINGKEFTDAKEAGRALQAIVDTKEYVEAGTKRKISQAEYDALTDDQRYATGEKGELLLKWTPRAAPIEVEFNGQRYTGREKLSEAYAELRGDMTPPMWTYKGTTYDRAANLEGALLPDVSTAVLDEKVMQLGKLGDFEVSVEGQGKARLSDDHTIEIVVSYGGQSLDTVNAISPNPEGLRRGTRNVISAAMSLANGASSRAAWLQDDLRRAQATADELAKTEAMGEWPGAAKLAAKRQEHREVLKRLSSAAVKKTADGVNIAQTGAPEANETDVLFSQAVAPTDPFYSELARQIERNVMRSADASNWLNMIRGLTAKGVKPDEIAWTGIEEWLRMQQGKVTKQAIVDYLDGNGVRVTEKVLGRSEVNDAQRVLDAADFLGYESRAQAMSALRRDFNRSANADKVLDAYDLTDDERAVLKTWLEANDLDEDKTKYGQYTLPGGTNYREVLLTLPTRQDAINEHRSFLARMRQQYPGTIAERSAAMSADERAQLDRLGAAANAQRDAPTYKSGHWDQPNVLAHIRVNDRVDSDGKRVLFVEEIQSDWGQAAKKKGVRSRSTMAYLDDIRAANARGDTEAARRLADEMGNDQGVPAAPFVTKTDAWVSLALKRIVKMAVDEGYDRVAFVNGEQSADRYDLSKQVNYIQWNPGFNATRKLISVETAKGEQLSLSTQDGIIDDSSIGGEGKRLDEVFGKEIASKIEGADSGNLRGLDLKVGGEGMRAFYDKIVPGVLKDVLRKVGGQVGVVKIGEAGAMYVGQDTDGRWSVFEANGDRFLFGFKEKAAAEAAMAKEFAGTLTQPGFDITPAMREKAAGGLPLFAQGAVRGTGSTVASVQREIATLFPGDTSNAITVLPTADGLPPAIRERFKAAGAKAVTIARNRVYLVADQIEPGTVRALVMHELGVHVGLKPDDIARFTSQIERWAQGTGQLADMAKLALRAGRDSASTNASDEPVAYMVQFMVDAGWTPQRAPIAARGLFQRFIEAIKAALKALGLRAPDITPQDMVDYVYGAAKMALRAPRPSSPASQFANASQFSQAPKTDTPEFKRWFGDSKVIDAQGKPLVVYHGTTAEHQPRERDDNGIWFTDHRDVASIYATERGKFRAAQGEDVAPNVVPAYLSMQNPLVVDAKWMPYDAINIRGVNYTTDELFIEARKKGHDGLIVRNVDDLEGIIEDKETVSGPDGSTVYAVMRPEQIKSAIGNRGTFDLESADIRFSQGKRQIAPVRDRNLADRVAALNMNPDDSFDAAVALGKGWRIFAMNEMDERLSEIFNPALVENFAPDQLFLLPPNRQVPSDADTTDIRFSQFPSVRDIALPAQYRLGDLFDSAGKLSWWHKSVGTMHNLAKRSEPFRRVYDAAQRFINDTSYYATEAADLAPKLLPKLETWRDIGKSPISAADNNAIRAPIFEGTLTWARDEQGNAVRVKDLEVRAGAITPETKARELFRRGLITEAVLKMWQGMPVEQYEAAVNTRYANQVLKPGVVFTDAELRQHFNLSAGQIKLYREFRAATDRSITNMAIADMLRYGGDDVAALREQALAAGTADQAALLLRDHLFKLAEENEDRAAVLNDTANTIVAKGERATDLIRRGYAPLMRFGQYTLDVVDEDGERVYFGLFETARERARMERQMRANYPKARIATGTTSQEDHKLFAGISPETVELFGEMLGLEADGGGAANEAFQTYLKRAKATRSAMKRLIERKGIAGFSEDAGRVLAGFVVSNARQTSTGLHMGELTDAVEAIPQGQGQLKDAAVQLYQYVRNPQEEAQAIRGLLFAQYLGGSFASAIVNALQPFQVTFPYLSQYAGIAGAAGHMRRAVADALKRNTGDKALDAALHVAEERGIVSPQEVHQLIGQAAGKATLKPETGLVTKADNALSRLQLAWGKVFGVAEQFNRRSTFIAAYRIAVEKGMADPAAFAEQAVVDTQFNYTKANRPKWSRGAVGSVLFTFKTYSISYVELMHRMWTAGKPGSPERAAGRLAASLGLGVLVFMSGLSGLPGADDFDDVLDGAMQRLFGLNFQSKLARQKFFAETLGMGDLGSRIIEHGFSAIPGIPIDVSGRLGLGNLIPGTRLLTKKQDYGRDVAEIAGPVADFAKRAAEAVGAVAQGDLRAAVEKVVPIAAQNALKAIDMANSGRYKDQAGKKVIDTDGYDAAVKAIGFQPADVAVAQRAARTAQGMKALNVMREAEIADAWAKGIAENDPDAVAEARADLAAWNRANPDTPIRININQIRMRVRALNESRAERLARTSPKEIRAEVRRQLEAAQ